MDDAKRSVNCSTRDFLAAWWRGDAGPVPCGDCSACCCYAGIPVDKRRDRKRLPCLLTERNADGELVLQRHAAGACVHLGEQGCTVYEHRPSACRSFDCRAFSAMGLVEHCDGRRIGSSPRPSKPGPSRRQLALNTGRLNALSRNATPAGVSTYRLSNPSILRNGFQPKSMI
jgi:hypothetical protein